MSVNEPKIREQILALLSRKDYRPLNKIEIANKLGVSGRARVALREHVARPRTRWRDRANPQGSIRLAG